MARLACISLPRIDLQLLVREKPEWKQLPTAVVTEEKPLGRITAVNRAAKNSGVQPGMRYASALSVCPQLRAGVIMPEEIDALRAELIACLREFSPEVEPSGADAALFWVNAAGLHHIYPSIAKWAGTLQTAVERKGFVCSVAAGFTRFGTYAAAKSSRTVTIFQSESQEDAAAQRAPAGVLPLDHEVLLRFHQLAIYTIRDFIRFSPGALRRRFGREVEMLQLFARGEQNLPVQPAAEVQILQREIRLLYPEASVEALLHYICGLLAELVSQAWREQGLITELLIEFHPEEWPNRTTSSRVETVRPAQPTLSEQLLEKLIRLRIEGIVLADPVVRLVLEAHCVDTTRDQGDLFRVALRRDPQKAHAAIAEVRAELGNDAVHVAELQNAHLPEEQFAWRRVEQLPVPRIAETRRTQLVRRILHEPTHLSRLTEDMPVLDAAHPHVKGPYILSGGWWRSAYRREYYYLEDDAGRILWLYYDEPQKQWMLQGVVE